MKINLPWINDPKTNEGSVSLTAFVISFVAVMVTSGLEMAGKVKGTSIILEVFWGTTALYFGRRFSIKGNSFGEEKSSDNQQK